MEPLKLESFLSSSEYQALFGNIIDICAFQRQFLNNLLEAIALEPNLSNYTDLRQFRVSIFYYIYVRLLHFTFIASDWMEFQKEQILHVCIL